MIVKRHKLLRFGAIAAAFVLIVLAGYAGVKYTMAYLFPDVWESDEDDVDDPLPPDQMNLLLLGLDAQEGETVARADSIVFVHADTEAQKVAMMSIPRDTRVEIPQRGMDKINSTTVYGGPDMTREVVSDLLGVPVPYYVVVDFDGFEKIVDILGGVDIDVEDRMYYRAMSHHPPLIIDLHPGLQRLDGNKAMQYVRWRGDGLGDIGRTQRQQKFLLALADEMLKPKSILKLPKLIPELRKNVETNLGLRKMVKWAGMVRKLDGLEMTTATLPGTFWDSGGVSYWYVDPEHAKVAFSDFIAGNPIPDPFDREVRPPAPVAVPRPQEPEPPAETEEGPDDTEPGEPGEGEWDGGSYTPGDAPDGSADGDEPPHDGGVPDWIPVGDVPGAADDGHGRSHHRPPYNGRPAPGANVEYGSLPDDGAAVGG